jgi:peptide/nickel transport system permease protein
LQALVLRAFGAVCLAFHTRHLARAILLVMILMALFADCLAGERPIIASQDGDLVVLESVNMPLAQDDWALWPIIRFDPRAVRTDGQLAILQKPSQKHLLGTDDRGRDVASRLIHGAKLSLLLALSCACLATVGGMLLAIVAVARPRLDASVLTLCDLLAAVPALLLVLVVRGLSGSESLVALAVLISVPRAASTARVVREGLRAALSQPFCEAARAIGATRQRLLWRHALPQSFGQIRVAAGLTASTAVVAEVALSFLGLGAGGPSWGELLTQAHHHDLAYWLLLPSGLATSLLAWSFGQFALHGAVRGASRSNAATPFQT